MQDPPEELQDTWVPEDVLDKIDIIIEDIFKEAKEVAIESHGDVMDDEER